MQGIDTLVRRAAHRANQVAGSTTRCLIASCAHIQHAWADAVQMNCIIINISICLSKLVQWSAQADRVVAVGQSRR
jgi:hypothetical protein